MLLLQTWVDVTHTHTHTHTHTQEELTGMAIIPGVDPCLLHLTNQEEMKVEDVEEEEEEEEKKVEEKKALSLVPPPSLLKVPVPQLRLGIFVS